MIIELTVSACHRCPYFLLSNRCLIRRRHLPAGGLSEGRPRSGGISVRMLQQMAKTLAAHRSGLLAYYDAMITSGPLEGTNNKIKTMKRMAYGFRDREFFKLKILAIHETRYALVG